MVTMLGGGGWPAGCAPPGEGFWGSGPVRRHRLQRHRTAQPRVFGLVDHAHGPAAELGLNLVLAQFGEHQRFSPGHSRGASTRPPTRPILPNPRRETWKGRMAG